MQSVLFTLFLLLASTLVRANSPAAKCQPGYFSSSGREPCCECCAGFYAASSGATSCDQCPSSFPYSSPGSTSLFSCGRGTGYTSTCTVSGDQCPATTPPPNPTQGNRRRSVPKRQWCPKGQKNCPVYGTNGRWGYLKAYECVDVLNDLESCGGCVGDDTPPGGFAQDGGRDCSAIPNVDSVGCSTGRCVIESCRRGFNITADGEDCVADSDAGIISLQLLDYA